MRYLPWLSLRQRIIIFSINKQNNDILYVRTYVRSAARYQLAKDLATQKLHVLGIFYIVFKTDEHV